MFPLSASTLERVLYTVESLIEVLKNSGADAVGGHTRSHPEHDG